MRRVRSKTTRQITGQAAVVRWTKVCHFYSSLVRSNIGDSTDRRALGRSPSHESLYIRVMLPLPNVCVNEHAFKFSQACTSIPHASLTQIPEQKEARRLTHPPGPQTLTACLIVKNAGDARHAELRIGISSVMLTEEFPDMNTKEPFRRCRSPQ